eukprot:COSAG02_NODE_291_length_25510_cov_9.433828_6_plen_355_part_00
MPGDSSGIGWGWSEAVTYALGAAVLGGAVFTGSRRARRVAAAKSRLSDLLSTAAAAGDARVVITGATSGVGEELAMEFGRHPSVCLLLGCRDITRGEAVAARCGPGQATVAQLDCLDMSSVRHFAARAQEFLETDTKAASGLRLVVNNAGVMSCPEKSSADGFEPTWATNFLTPFHVTELLASSRTVHSSPPLRVVNVSSRLEKRSKLTADMLDLVASPAADQQKSSGAVRNSAYSDSKRALMLWITARSNVLANDHATYVHATTPGMVDTQLGRHSMSPILWPLTKPLRWLLLRSPAEGALSAVAAGLIDGADRTAGRYMDAETVLETLPETRATQAGLASAVVEWANQACKL